MAKQLEETQEQKELTEQQKIVQKVFSQPKTVITIALSLKDGIVVGIDGVTPQEAEVLLGESIEIVKKTNDPATK